MSGGILCARSCCSKVDYYITLCIMQRDVLGVTRGAVPILARSGVEALTVGCNGAGAPPGVPKNQPFVWRDIRTGTQIIAMWHAGLRLPHESL